MANLVHLIHRFPPATGGAEIAASMVCCDQIRNGHSVRVETTTALHPDSFFLPGSEILPAGVSFLEGIQVHRHALWRFPLQRPLLAVCQRMAPLALRPWLGWYSPIAPTMCRLALQEDFAPDLAIGWALPHGSILASACRLAKACKIPLVLIPLLHPGNPNRANCPIRRAFLRPELLGLLAQADLLLALTDWEAEILASHGLNRSRISVTGLGIDSNSVTGGNRLNFRKRLNILGEKTKVIGHLATLSPEKGTLDLLAARARIPGDNLVVVLAGLGNRAFQRRLEPFRKASWLRQTGPLDTLEKKDFFAGIDLFCLPSIADAWSLTLLEAWSAGVPAVVYNAGGPGALVRHGIDGWKVEPGNVSALAETLSKASANPEILQQMGALGKTRAKNTLTWPNALERIDLAIRPLLKTKTP